MSCENGIVKNIISNCTTSKSGGLEVEAYVFNRTELSPTYDGTILNKVTSLAVDVGKQGFKITGVKKLLNAGHDAVTAEDRDDVYTHYFSFQQFEFAAEDIANVDALKDLVIVVENKDKVDDGDGVFVAYGLQKGLYKSTDSKRSNDINGARNLELASLPGQEEKYSAYVVLDTDYATTKALLEALMAVQV